MLKAQHPLFILMTLFPSHHDAFRTPVKGREKMEIWVREASPCKKLRKPQPGFEMPQRKADLIRGVLHQRGTAQ